MMRPKASLLLAVAVTAITAAGPLAAQTTAPENQTATNPAPAEDAAATAAGTVNSPGTITTAATADAAPAARAGNEEIIVTAQFRSQKLQDTPLAITAVSAAMLEARSQTNISEVAAQAPSVTLKSNSASYGPSLAANIRGVGQFDFHPALEPGVGIYVDDVYYSTLTGSVLDLLDLERVEVLRGPQGTLAGKNSIGGAIKLYSKKPEGTDTGYASATYGIRDRFDFRGAFDLGIAEGLAVRLAGVSRDQDGYVKRLDYGCVNPGQGIPALREPGNCVLSRQGEVGYRAVRGQMRWFGDGPIEINLIGDYTREKHEIAGSVATFSNYTGPSDINPFPTPQRLDSRFICGRYCNYSAYRSPADGPFLESVIPGQVDYKGGGVSGQIDWQLADRLTLTSITAYRKYVSRFSNEDDLSPLSHSLGGQNTLDFHNFSQELRLNGSAIDNRLNYTIGGYYLDQKTFYTARQDLRYVAGGGLVFVSGDPVPAFTKAVFANASFDLTEALSLTGGIRYNKEGKDYSYRRRDRFGNLLGGQNALLDGRTGRFRGDRVDYRGVAQYRFSDAVMAYAQYSTGFKGGGVNPRPFAFTQVQPFGPETLKTVEIGTKTDLLDRRVRLNLAAFSSRYDGVQLSLNACPQFNPPGLPAGAAFPCNLPANVGSADIKGVELEANLRPTEGLLIDGAVSYLDFEYRRIDPLAGGPSNPSGVQLDMISPYTPKWKWSVGAQYEVPLGPIGFVTPRLDASYQSSVYGTAVNSARTFIPGYTVANARLTYRNTEGDIEVSAELTNIFDKYYFLTSFEINSAAGIANAQPGRPREWALSIRKKF
ncbi:MAG: TonB-dependent receptor [Sphingomonas fennica]